MRQFSFLLLVSFSLLANQANAAVINEILIEPSGPNEGQQFFELKGNPNESLAGMSFVILIGEAGGLGIIDQVLDLSPYSLGSNGLLLWRDSPAVLDPPPDAGTSLVIGGFPFTPAFLSNISQTFALVTGFTGSVGDDLDTDNDGILDTLPWSGVADAIGIRENDSTPDNEFAFGTQLGFSDFPVLGFDPDGIFRDGKSNRWYAADVFNSSNTGPYAFDDSEFVDLNLTPQDPSSFTRQTMTPGSINAAIPEPATSLGFVVGIGFLLVVRSRTARLQPLRSGS